MPITKKKNGWFWGGRGPFKTRKKAVQVAQAAYASGYVKKSWKDILKQVELDLDESCCSAMRRDFTALMEKHFDEKTSLKFAEAIQYENCSRVAWRLQGFIDSVAPQEAIEEAKEILLDYNKCIYQFEVR